MPGSLGAVKVPENMPSAPAGKAPISPPGSRVTTTGVSLQTKPLAVNVTVAPGAYSAASTEIDGAGWPA